MSGKPPGVASSESRLRNSLESPRSANDEGSISDTEYARITEMVSAYSGDEPSTPTPPGEGTRKKTTLKTWVDRLRLCAERSPVDLTEATAEDINQYWA